MSLAELTNEQISKMDDGMLVLAQASISRLPSYDNEEGKAALVRFQTEIAKRNIDVVATLTNILPRD